MLTIRNVTYNIGNRTLLNDISAQVFEGQKIGLVGRNGSGKSTLFKLILGHIHSDKGMIELANHKRITTVAQEMPDSETLSALNFVIQSDHTRNQLMQDLESCQDPNKMGDIYEKLIQIDAFGAESRAATVLKGLGFNHAEQLKPINSFSGGYRMRIALAVALFQPSDLLLLDEPTNHLDIETVMWLRDFLKKTPSAVLLISHDREFLNDTIQYVLHLYNSKLTSYKGNFDQFLELFEQQQAFTASYNAKLQAQRDHMMKFVNRFKAKASKAKQAQSRLKAIEKIKLVPVDSEDHSVSLNFPEVPNIASPLINFEKVNLGYGEKIVLKNLKGSIQNDDRIALLGHNGNGKTTFARFLCEELQALTGEVHKNSKLKIGYYRQDQFESLDLSQTAFSLIKDSMPRQASETSIRGHLGRFGFPKEKADQTIHSLSGGERARLVFCQITTQEPNMLILDEPTNHLDIEMRESLIRSINAFSGAVILITHDRHLLRHVADYLWVVADQKITPFAGTIDEYLKF